MPKVTLYEHQKQALKLTKNKTHVAYYLDMGLGKTFCGSEKIIELQKQALIVCPKSMIETWMEHLKAYYPQLSVGDLTKKKFSLTADVLIINYDIVWRREYLKKLRSFTMLLDESSYIQNDTAKRTKGILKLHYENVILLSGTPTAGKYEKLYTQLKLLGWDISKKLYWKTYVEWIELDCGTGFPIPKVTGYKNVDRLKRKLGDYGAVFMKTEDVFDLPDQIDINIPCTVPKEYGVFRKDCIVDVEGKTLVGDMPLNRLLYTRQLCSIYAKDKLDKLKDLLESTEDRLIIFYNFTEEREIVKKLTKKPISILAGDIKDLSNYDRCSDSITLIQYKAGSMGPNLQKADKTIYISPPLSAEHYLQSRKRTHRIGQDRTCFYYHLVCGIEKDIYKVLAERKDYTLKLFE
jgi:SNF2 family DNA or RNA helicase